MTYIFENEENVVRISSAKKIDEYAWPMLTRFQPEPYENFEYLKLRFAKNMKHDVFKLVNLWGNLGIEVKEIFKITDPLVLKDMNKLTEHFEIKLVKIGAIRYPNKEEFEKRLLEEFEKIK